MTTKLLKIDGMDVFVEVDESEAVVLPQGGNTGRGQAREGMEMVSAVDRITDIGDQLRRAISSVTNPIRESLKQSEPNEWSLELNLGFKGESGIPTLLKGEANGAIKLTAKWTKT